MIVRRQYRGGYQFAGLVELARELRKKQTSLKYCCGSSFEIVTCWGSSSDDSISLVITSRTFYCHDAQLVIECDESVF